MAAGMRHSLDLVLNSRGLIPSHQQRSTIDACTSVDMLERWVARAGTVSSITELLEA